MAASAMMPTSARMNMHTVPAIESNRANGLVMESSWGLWRPIGTDPIAM